MDFSKLVNITGQRVKCVVQFSSALISLPYGIQMTQTISIALVAYFLGALASLGARGKLSTAILLVLGFLSLVLVAVLTLWMLSELGTPFFLIFLLAPPFTPIGFFLSACIGALFGRLAILLSGLFEPDFRIFHLYTLAALALVSALPVTLWLSVVPQEMRNAQHREQMALEKAEVLSRQHKGILSSHLITFSGDDGAELMPPGATHPGHAITLWNVASAKKFAEENDTPYRMEAIKLSYHKRTPSACDEGGGVGQLRAIVCELGLSSLSIRYRSNRSNSAPYASEFANEGFVEVAENMLPTPPGFALVTAGQLRDRKYYHWVAEPEAYEWLSTDTLSVYCGPGSPAGNLTCHSWFQFKDDVWVELRVSDQTFVRDENGARHSTDFVAASIPLVEKVWTSALVKKSRDLN